MTNQPIKRISNDLDRAIRELQRQMKQCYNRDVSYMEATRELARRSSKPRVKGIQLGWFK